MAGWIVTSQELELCLVLEIIANMMIGNIVIIIREVGLMVISKIKPKRLHLMAVMMGGHSIFIETARLSDWHEDDKNLNLMNAMVDEAKTSLISMESESFTIVF